MTHIKSGAELIADERTRQTTEEGYDASHDDMHDAGELLNAASSYIKYTQDKPFESNASSVYQEDRDFDWYSYVSKLGWPWDTNSFAMNPEHWGEKDSIRNLVKAGALIAAEIDRLQRKS